MGKSKKETVRKKFTANLAICTGGRVKRISQEFVQALLMDRRVPVYLGSRVPMEHKPTSVVAFAFMCSAEKKVPSISVSDFRKIMDRIGSKIEEKDLTKTVVDGEEMVDMLAWPRGDPFYNVTYTIEVDSTCPRGLDFLLK